MHGGPPAVSWSTSLPVDVRRLIAAIARANVTWRREERIAAELQLKLGIHGGIWDR